MTSTHPNLTQFTDIRYQVFQYYGISTVQARFMSNNLDIPVCQRNRPPQISVHGYLHFPGWNRKVQVLKYGRLPVLLVRAPHDHRRRWTGHGRGLLQIFCRSFVARHHRRGHVGHGIVHEQSSKVSHTRITGGERYRKRYLEKCKFSYRGTPSPPRTNVYLGAVYCYYYQRV